METNKCPKVIDEVLSGDSNVCDTRQEVVQPADIMAALTETECENLKNNTGLDGSSSDNCEDLQGGLLCDIRQELEAVLKNESMTIYANDFSKCSETDENPTLASMWSRIYRFSQATSCILCAFDPFIIKLLKSGRFPQVLMGAPADVLPEDLTGYPVWVSPDTYPTASSTRPVTSDGVYRAVEDAILSVWHIWREHPQFEYYADHTTEGVHPLSEITDMEVNDTALVKDNGEGEYNVIYKYYDDDWQKEEVIGTDIPNFTVTHIVKGYFEGKGIYYFDDSGTPTWQIMDANLSELEERMDVLEEKFNHAIISQTSDTNSYMLTTRATLAQANAVPATSGRTTLIFITG